MKCEACRKQEATQLFEWIADDGAWGLTRHESRCDDCASKLVRITRRRYVITPIYKPKPKRQETPSGEQLSWGYSSDGTTAGKTP